MSSIDFLILIEVDKLIVRFKNIWNNLTDISNRDLNLTKSNIAINRELEMEIYSFRQNFIPLRNQVESLLDKLKNKKENIYRKIL